METYGDLKKAIKSIQLKKRGAKVGDVAIDVVLGAIPGIGAAKSTYDVVRAAFRKPDTRKSNSWLDKLDIDDEMEAIVDDTVENGFLKMQAKVFDAESDAKPLEKDFNMNQKMVDYLKKNYKQRTVTGIAEDKLVFDKFFTKFAYKFDKGYPDMNNPTDVALLESLISEAIGENFNLKEATDAEAGIEILKKEFPLKDEDFVRQSSVTYKLLVPRAERFDYAQKIDAIEDFEYDPNMKGSSIGGIKYKGAKFLIKPTGVQGRASAGTENEDILVNELKKYLEDGPKNVVFVGSNKNYSTSNIKDVLDVGYDTASGKKADVVLIGDKKYPISIKKDNAGFWESSDSRYKDVVNKLSEKIKNREFAPKLVFKPFVDKLGNTKEGINIMYNEETDTKVSGVIVTDLPSKDEDSIIFGSDDAVVIYKTYSPKDFSEEGDTIRVEVSKIIENLNDVEEFNLEPVLNIRHDSTRSATGGLRATVQPENLLYRDGKLTGNKIEIPYKDIM